MKRIISLLLALMLVSFCLGLNALATQGATLSEDETKLVYNDAAYTRVNSSMLVQPELNNDPVVFSLSREQAATIQSGYFYTSRNGDVLAYATITYLDGSTLTATYVKDSCLDEYTAITSGQSEELVVDFMYPDGNTVDAAKDDLFGEKTTLDDAFLYDSYPVYAQDDTASIRMETGALLVYDEEYYYVDFAESGIDGSLFTPDGYVHLDARQITDEALIEKLSEAEDKYYSDDLGFLFNDEFSEAVSTAAIIIGLIIIPLAVLILYLIFAIRSKGTYRKLYVTICALAGTVLCTVGIIYALLNF